MARRKGRRARLVFDRRSQAEIERRSVHPEVAAALDTIREEGARFYSAGLDLGLWVAPKGRVAFDPLSSERHTCRRHGLDVRFRHDDSGPPTVVLMLTFSAHREQLVARPAIQNLLAEAEYDVWEIKRDAPLSRILEEIETQKRELDDSRARRGVKRHTVTRGRSAAQQLRALDMYRSRCLGRGWKEVSRRHRLHHSSARRAVRVLCERFDLPIPGVTVAGPPLEADCDNCLERPLSPTGSCDGCPWLRWLALKGSDGRGLRETLHGASDAARGRRTGRPRRRQ
jgi:hypothetical protein